ncbi:hypothetical protein HDG34_005869 [Paraburkholderia sp. HC6.4b]|uniref:hypothetical protein n=1 Tax=unclassified Paraburkholderia TaxID=2615204 RepID=UPI001615D539|nr:MULTISPECIES: hypothetical protein [unclassified Paraburkholderia]MBB5411903.1 hypothetical protein [Paraburkholderia sp. HC6.4b]MBB5450215.1 hypothetical protein [Paraburkholderia sp. Kb1A]
MSYAEDILTGVQEVIAEIGEPISIERITRAPDPAHPTSVIETRDVYTGMGVLIGPRRTWDKATLTVIEVTEFYVDLLSLVDADGSRPNTLDAVTVVTDNGDVVMLTGTGQRWTLLDNEAPRIEGRQVAAFHRVAA